MSECNKSWSDRQMYDRAIQTRAKFPNKLRIEDLKIEGGQLESQELPVYYST
jgi:hypothetical protein